MSVVYFNLHTHEPQPNGLMNVHPHENIPNQIFSTGFHPLFLEKQLPNENWNLFLEKSKHPLCKAIGECGLDRRAQTDFDEQIDWFEKHIKVAMELQKPLIIHCVQAYETLLPILEKHEVTAILHGFNQNAQIHHQALRNNNLYFSFGKALMQDQNNAIERIQSTPLERIFLETDDGAGIDIEQIYAKAVKLLKMDESKLFEQIEKNRQLVFGYL